MWIELPTFESIDSTNTYVREHVNQLPHRSVLRSRYQTSGRGQFDRVWQSNPDENLLFSILLKSIPIDAIEQVRLWIRDGLLTWLISHGVSARFKLPNDILVEHQKIIGILIETRQSNEEFQWVIVGIGINLNQTEFEISTATSLRKLTNNLYDVTGEFHHLLERLDATYPFKR